MSDFIARLIERAAGIASPEGKPTVGPDTAAHWEPPTPHEVVDADGERPPGGAPDAEPSAESNRPTTPAADRAGVAPAAMAGPDTAEPIPSPMREGQRPAPLLPARQAADAFPAEGVRPRTTDWVEIGEQMSLAAEGPAPAGAGPPTEPRLEPGRLHPIRNPMPAFPPERAAATTPAPPIPRAGEPETAIASRPAAAVGQAAPRLSPDDRAVPDPIQPRDSVPARLPPASAPVAPPRGSRPGPEASAPDGDGAPVRVKIGRVEVIGPVAASAAKPARSGLADLELARRYLDRGGYWG